MPVVLQPACLDRPVDRVVWDWNGTLFDDAWLCVDVMNTLLREHDLPEMTLPHYQRIFDFPVETYYRRLGFDFAHASFEELGTLFIRRYEQRKWECQLHRGARDLLNALAARNIPQVLLSAYEQSTLDQLVSHFALDDYFESVLGHPDHYAAGKTERGRRWAAETGEDPSRFLFIGDTAHDADVARAVGAQCMLVEGGNQDRDRLAACGVPLFPDLRGLETSLFGGAIQPD